MDNMDPRKLLVEIKSILDKNKMRGRIFGLTDPVLRDNI